MGAQRNGLRKARNLAQTLCNTVTFWTPVIQAAFPGNLALMAALSAANAACAQLVEQADSALPSGE